MLISYFGNDQGILIIKFKIKIVIDFEFFFRVNLEQIRLGFGILEGIKGKEEYCTFLPYMYCIYYLGKLHMKSYFNSLQNLPVHQLHLGIPIQNLLGMYRLTLLGKNSNLIKEKIL